VACKLIYEPFPGSSGGGVRVKHSSHAISLHPMTISVSMSTYRFRLRGRVNFGLITVHGRWNEGQGGQAENFSRRDFFSISRGKKQISPLLAPPGKNPSNAHVTVSQCIAQYSLLSDIHQHPWTSVAH